MAASTCKKRRLGALVVAAASVAGVTALNPPVSGAWVRPSTHGWEVARTWRRIPRGRGATRLRGVAQDNPPFALKWAPQPPDFHNAIRDVQAGASTRRLLGTAT
jgi:hypothetical protein